MISTRSLQRTGEDVNGTESGYPTVLSVLIENIYLILVIKYISNKRILIIIYNRAYKC